MQEEILLILSELSAKIPNLTYIKEIKSGKEATVHLVTDGSQMYALKIYKKNSKYSSKLQYLNLESVADSRTRRAIKNRSKTGVDKLENIWTEREYTLLKELSSLSQNIPIVFGSTSSAILLEYFGTEEQPAPRLVDVQLDSKDALFCFNEIVRNMELFLELGFVHGDFSPYNILWWNNMPYIIDFPQALDIKTNKNAYEKLLKDLDNIEKYFSKDANINVIKNTWSKLIYKFNLVRIYG